jgi:hypothetical protein
MSDDITPSTPAPQAAAPAAPETSPVPPATPEVHPTKSFIDAFLAGGPLFVNKLREHLLSLWTEFEQVAAERDALVTKFGDKAKAVIDEIRKI